MYYNPFTYTYNFQTTNLTTDGWKPVTDLEKIVYILNHREVYYQRYYDYYDGIHNLQIAVKKFRDTFGNSFKEFADNLCETVVDTMVERLEVIGFTLESESSKKNSQIALPVNPSFFQQQKENNNNNQNENNIFQPQQIQTPKKETTLADKAWDIWRSVRMKQVQHEIHLEACLAGDAYLIIWTNPETNEVCCHPQKASEFYIKENYEDKNNPEYAGKVWWEEIDEEVRKRVNVYYPDRIEKYVSVKGKKEPKKENDFIPYYDENEKSAVVNPYGRVPAFRFSHKSRMGGLGKSELKNVIPIQDALNKSIMDLMVGMEFVAIQQRWATGIEIKTDPITGEDISPFESGSDSVWHTANSDAKFGQFPDADMTKFLAVMNDLRMEVARISRTPLHYFTPQTGNAPSGAALRTIEKPLVAKCEKAQNEFGDVWEDVTEFMLLIQKEVNQLGKTQLESIWKPARSEDEKEDLETAQLKINLGVSKKQVLIELGYTEEQILSFEMEEAFNKHQEFENQKQLIETQAKNRQFGNNGNGNVARR